MTVLTINGNEYKLEFTIEASMHKNLVSTMFKVLSGSYMIGGMVGADNSDESKAIGNVLDNVGNYVSEIPHFAKLMFHAGLLENNPMTEQESYTLLKEYMKQEKKDFMSLFNELKGYMEKDGFFEISGLTKQLESMTKAVEEQTEKAQKKVKKFKVEK